jgi:hypothetical protein
VASAAATALEPRHGRAVADPRAGVSIAKSSFSL